MESISRYHLSQHEDGSWHVIDAKTGGPAEIEFEGQFVLLWKMPRQQAEAWSNKLNAMAKANKAE